VGHTGAVSDRSETGVVEEWDDPRGVGLVRADDGRALDLQCTHIADGSRTTTVGTRVRFVAAPGHHGHWQATHVTNR
jgi:cold shock CspA family protein